MALEPAACPECVGRGMGRSLFLHAVRFYEKIGMHKIRERHSEVEGQPRILPVIEMKMDI